jgi:hypothetical protein
MLIFLFKEVVIIPMGEKAHKKQIITMLLRNIFTQLDPSAPDCTRIMKQQNVNVSPLHRVSSDLMWAQPRG